MKHPTILPGRAGLPPTSNIPWSAADEKMQRTLVLWDFIAMWTLFAITIVVLSLTRWILAPIPAIGVVLFFWHLQRDRRKLYAMLLNKPRDVSNLTQWTEHRWRGWAVLDRQFFCACGRMVDLSTAGYFKSTSRFSMVCECGRGHFQIPPKIGRPAVVR